MVFRLGPNAAPRPRASDIALRAMTPDAAARAAGFGRWWHDPHLGAIVLSLEAAQLIGELPGVHAQLADCFSSVLPEDLVQVTSSLTCGAECEFRILTSGDGLRFLRLVTLPPGEEAEGLVEGILIDITSSRHAAMREQFSFESTQLMIGTSTLDEAVSKMIALVCTHLGWDCGMYWSIAQSGSEAGRLVLSHYWSGEARAPAEVFEKTGGQRLSIAPREGVVGAVWSSGKPRWIEDIATDPQFLYPAYAQQSGIHSGYAFPVAYDSDDGRRHRPGVLIFFSCLSRQRTAQLPRLSEAIGGLIAQTAQRLAQQENIRELAQVDALSGLANRRHFHDLLDQACQRATARGVPLGVLFIDLDRFKPINDGLGHAIGDAVLSLFAQRLSDLTPRAAHAGRVGGDEFALFLYPGDSPTRMQEMAEKVLAAARTPFVVDGRELVISASVGVSMYPADGGSAAELLRNADTAMYRVKRGGRNGIGYFTEHGSHGDAGSQDALLLQLTVEVELIHALAGQRLFLEYQPVIDADSGRVRAVEALVRWRRHDGTVVPPDVFIPIAEKSHLIVDIGRWVIRQACLDLPRMHAAGLEGLQLNVNMAAREFMNEALPAEMEEITLEAGVDPRFVCLELTEGMMMNHPDQVIPVMHALRGHGFKISVDDFGMGYSSLSRLKDLPISSLKIDRSFVSGLPDDHQDRAMVQTIVDIGRNMHLDVIAEGVERDEQLQMVRQLGCTMIQGYFTGRPMSLEQLIQTHGAG
ncbi:MAG TPA: EAL domain-containing protein [Telluria sp.]